MRHPSRFRHLVAAAAVVVTLAVAATRARADVPPPDLCTAPGQSCMNAGPQFNGAGTCVATTCTKQVPAPDGGMMPMTYDCNLCTAGGGDGGSHPSSGSSGCALAPTSSGGSGAAVLLVGTLVVTARRRKSIG